MKHFLSRALLAVHFVLLISISSIAGPLDEHYLSAYADQVTLPAGSALQKAVLLPAAEAVDPPHCGTHLKHGLQRDWTQLEPATQRTLAKQLAAPVLSGQTATLSSPSGRFLIHYTTTGADAVPSLAWVQTVAQTFDDVSASYSGLGWKLAPTAAGAAYDVYLRELSDQRLYGQTTTSGPLLAAPGFANAIGSFIEIDNNYLEAVYQNALGGPLTVSQKALQSLQITAAHEYHHAIQYGYNVFFDVWYAEATATWFEDELYDNVNQLFNYLSASLRNTNLSLDIDASVSTGGGYGRWLFNRHLAEAQGGQAVIRSFWERVAITVPPPVGDIPMTPILDAILLTKTSSLGSELMAYATKLYTGAWTTKAAEIPLIPPVSLLPTSNIYPITVTSVPSPTITLPHYSFAFFRLLPSAGAPATLNITLTRDPGITAVAFIKANNSFTPVSPNPNTNLIVIPGFTTASEVVLLLANTTGNDNLFAGFSSDGTPSQYALPGTTITSATTTTTAPSVTLTWSAVTGATSYQIFRSATSSTSLALYDTTTATSFSDLNVINDHTYYYAVIPFKSAGLVGPASQVSTVKVPSTAPIIASAGGGGGGGGGCFIATAAYGSYLHPQVQILRDFRDTWLLTNSPGRAFVALYYRLSPPAAGFIAQHETLRLLVRLFLTPVIFIIDNLMLLSLLFATTLTAWQIRRICLIRNNHSSLSS